VYRSRTETETEMETGPAVPVSVPVSVPVRLADPDLRDSLYFLPARLRAI